MRIKPYLSYSQYSAFNRSKEQYKRIYIDGIKTQNKYTEFGKLIAKGLDRRTKTKDKDIEKARQLVKRPKETEKEIRVKFGEVPLFGKLDGYDPGHIREQKTSLNEWTQKMVDKSEQLTFYAIMVSEKFKIPIEKIKITLDWLPTFEDIDGLLHLTGELKSFKTKRTTGDKIKIYPKIKRTWVDIEKLIDDLI